MQPRTAPTATLLPNPAQRQPRIHAAAPRRSWDLGVTVSAGASNLRITQWSPELFDASGRSVDRETLTGADFSAFFNQCGPGSQTILAQADACAGVCVALGGASSGAAQITFTGLDDAGRVVTFATPRVPLLAPQ